MSRSLPHRAPYDAAIAEERPGLERRFVFISGGAFTDRSQAFLERVPNQRVDKPFTTEELEAAMVVAAGGVVKHCARRESDVHRIARSFASTSSASMSRPSFACSKLTAMDW